MYFIIYDWSFAVLEECLYILCFDLYKHCIICNLQYYLSKVGINVSSVENDFFKQLDLHCANGKEYVLGIYEI